MDSWASSPFRGWEVGLEIQPFGIGEVGRVALSHAPERTRSLCSGAFSNSLSRDCLKNRVKASGAYFFIGVQPQNRASLPCFVGSQELSSGPEGFFKQSL